MFIQFGVCLPDECNAHICNIEISRLFHHARKLAVRWDDGYLLPGGKELVDWWPKESQHYPMHRLGGAKRILDWVMLVSFVLNP